MLSICIPVYNFDVSDFVSDLQFQAENAGFAYEIILMDDASNEPFRAKNQAIGLQNVRYIQLQENIGRSKIRNRLSEAAQYPFLLFTDCDSAVSSASYLDNYSRFFESGIVCCGGRLYEEREPAGSTWLRWKYGVKRECASASERSKNPNAGFQTNNFLIDKRLFEKVKFNEDLTGYGHEDTLFGLELSAKGITVRHIDNPLIHIGLENAADFLEKTANGVVNLCKIEKLLREKYPHFIDHSRLMRAKLFIQKYHLSGCISMLYQLTHMQIKKHLLGKRPSLFIFDIYRLFLINQLM